jgi:hypothetical protein
MLLADSGDELCGLLPVLFQAVAYHPPLLAFLLLAPLPFSGVFSVFLPPLLCATFSFIVYCSVFFFFFLQGKGSVCPGGYAGLS